LLEYPTDEDPPLFLTRLARTHPDFWGQAGYYDLEPRKDASAQGKLWLSEETTSG
jgi:hypothetical protein